MRGTSATELAVLQRRLDETPEKRMAVHRPRFELGMELAAEKPGMVAWLDDLDQIAVRRQDRSSTMPLAPNSAR